LPLAEAMPIMRRIPNITRNIASRCVTARVTRAGQLHARNFGLAEFRTWTAAEKAASAWLKKLKPKLPAATPAKGRMTQRNASGIVGVQLKHSKRRGHDHYAWQAFWPDKPGGISWGIVKYGETQAFACAAIARKLETADRRVIEKKYLRLKGTAELRAILKRRKLSPP